MLSLSHAQTRLVADHAYRRGVERVGQALAQAFAAVAQRAGERYAALVEHGVEQATRLGLNDAMCAARYLACCFAWGMEFERRAGFEWAQAILQDGARAQELKAFQLCRRGAEQLQAAPAAGLPTREDFEAAVASLDARLRDWGRLGALAASPRLRMGLPCDLDALRIERPAQPWRQHYGVIDGRWQRVPSCSEAAVLDFAAAAPLPEQLSLFGQTAGEPARLRLRSHLEAVCDPAMHPLVSLMHDSGPRQWRGALARDSVVELAAGAPPPGPMAAEDSPSYHPLRVECCGLRDSGAAWGEAQTLLAVYPAQQWLLAWRRDKPQPSELSEAQAAPPASPPPARARLERDGQLLDAARWQKGLERLDAELAQSWQRLLLDWLRTSTVARGRLRADAAVLQGAAALSWGWREGAGGLAGPALMHLEALHDLIGCEIDLLLAGELEVDGARAELRLSARGRQELRDHGVRDTRQPEVDAMLRSCNVQWRWPLQVELLSHATRGLAQLRLAGAPQGALVGACGLRQRRDGPGLQWHASLALEPASVAIAWSHPLRGERVASHALLPQLSLLDWSLD